MKRPKPGFREYFKKRISDPFKFTEDIIFEDGRGTRLRDIGSPHTLIIKTALLLSVLMILCVFNWTADGYEVVVPAGAFILFSHRFSRYFWTNFEYVDEEGKSIEDKSLIYKVRRSKFEKWLAGIDDDSGIKYCRYNWRQKALIFIEAVFVFGIFFMIPIIASGSPYSRLYTVELENPDLPFITITYSADGSVTAPDPDRGKIPLKDADTLLQAYAGARSYIDTFCPEAEITDYAIELQDGEITYHLTFEYFRRGLIYKKDYAIMSVEVNAGEDWMKIYYWGYGAIESAFRRTGPPDKEIDTGRILEIVFRQTGKTEEDLEYYYIGANSLIPDPLNNCNPGGDTWYAEVHYKDDTHRLYTVNVSKGTASEIEWG